MPKEKIGRNTKKYADVPSLYIKIPPQAVDLEEAVLGALMLEKNALTLVGDILSAEDFYKSAHKIIYTAIKQLYIDDKAIDILTVAEAIKSMGKLDEVGGYAFLSQLTSKVASAVNIEHHARIIIQKSIERRLIRVCTELQDMSYDDSVDVKDLIDKAQKDIFDLADGNSKKDVLQIDQIVEQAQNRIKELQESDSEMSGVPSGFKALDAITGGWQPSDLIIIAARPAMGKTAFVLSMARNMAVDHNFPVAVFSLEMSAIQLVNRLIVGETEIASEKIKNGNFTPEDWIQFNSKIGKLSKSPIYVDDTPGLSIYELRAKSRRLKQKYDIKLVIVDYLQLMTAGAELKGNREQEVSTISRQLKIIAKELDIPVIALSQLNRQLEQRADKKPMLSDLRESGSIEQDADMVLFIHRPEKYAPADSQGNSNKGLTNIIIAKHRNGSVGEINLKFIAEFTKFCNLESSPFENEVRVSKRVVSSKLNDDVPLDQGLDINSDFDSEAPF